MFIIKATSKLTNVTTYFNGYISVEGKQINITVDWTHERMFATRLAYTETINAILDTLRKVDTNVDFILEQY